MLLSFNFVRPRVLLRCRVYYVVIVVSTTVTHAGMYVAELLTLHAVSTTTQEPYYCIRVEVFDQHIIYLYMIWQKTNEHGRTDTEISGS